MQRYIHFMPHNYGKQKTKLNDLHNNPNLKIQNCVKNHTNASSDEQNIQKGLITNVKKSLTTSTLYSEFMRFNPNQ